MKKVRFASTVIKIFMKNQMQDKTNIILDILTCDSLYEERSDDLSIE